MQKNSKGYPAQNQLLENELVDECTAMAKYAFASGLQVPGKIIQILENFTGMKHDGRTVSPGEPGSEPQDESMESMGPGDSTVTGNKPPAPLDIRPLIMVHERLARIVEPAKPRTILLMEKESQKMGIFKFLGAVPFIRRMMLAAVVCLVLFVSISLSPDINNKPETWNLFQSSGWPLLLKELFLLSAAGLGASFTALFRANRYIIEGTFDPKYESSYWIRFSLGFIAGMILATLIPIEESVRADFGKPLLAMLGGFSANLVYRIISRIIETLEALFRGDTRTMVLAQQEQAKALSAKEDVQNRAKMAANIMKIQQEIDSQMKPEEIKKKMGKLMDNMVGIDSDEWEPTVHEENKDAS